MGDTEPTDLSGPCEYRMLNELGQFFFHSHKHIANTSLPRTLTGLLCPAAWLMFLTLNELRILSGGFLTSATDSRLRRMMVKKSTIAGWYVPSKLNLPQFSKPGTRLLYLGGKLQTIL